MRLNCPINKYIYYIKLKIVSDPMNEGLGERVVGLKIRMKKKKLGEKIKGKRFATKGGVNQSPRSKTSQLSRGKAHCTAHS